MRGRKLTHHEKKQRKAESQEDKVARLKGIKERQKNRKKVWAAKQEQKANES